MTIAAWLARRWHGGSAARSALTWFGIQLILNLLWSVVFFGMQQPGFAMVEIILPWLASVATMVAFRGKSMAATILMVPYLAWTTFAAVLNFWLWKMNP